MKRFSVTALLILSGLILSVITVSNLLLNLALIEYVKGAIGPYHNVEHLNNSILLFEKTVLISPSARAYDFLGRVYLTQRNWDQALVNWEKTGYSVGHFISVVRSYKQVGFVSVLDIYAVLIDLAPDSGTAWYYRGQHLYELKNYEQAIQSYEQAILIGNLDEQVGKSDVYFHMGEALRAGGMTRKAYEAYAQATQINDFSRLIHEINAFYKQGEMLVWMGRYAEAIEPLQNAIYIEPDFYNAYSLLGVVAYQQGNTVDAIQAWEKAIAIEPKYVWPYLHLARMYQDLGESAKAIVYYRQVLILEPQNQAALEELAELEW